MSQRKASSFLIVIEDSWGYIFGASSLHFTPNDPTNLPPPPASLAPSCASNRTTFKSCSFGSGAPGCGQTSHKRPSTVFTHPPSNTTHAGGYLSVSFQNATGYYGTGCVGWFCVWLSVGWSVGWLVGFAFGCLLVGRLVGWLVCWLVEWLVCLFICTLVYLFVCLSVGWLVGWLVGLPSTLHARHSLTNPHKHGSLHTRRADPSIEIVACTQGVLRLQVPPRVHRLPLDGEERLLHALQRAAPRHGRRRLLRLPGQSVTSFELCAWSVSQSPSFDQVCCAFGHSVSHSL